MNHSHPLVINSFELIQLKGGRLCQSGEHILLGVAYLRLKELDECFVSEPRGPKCDSSDVDVLRQVESKVQGIQSS